MSVRKLSRVCQQCKQPSTKKDRVCYSNADKHYLHGACRGKNLHAQKKRYEFRWFYKQQPVAKATIRIKQARKEGDGEEQAPAQAASQAPKKG